ncbi:phosphatase PAP2 family protein [Pyxidicoccus fallax]|uniref:Phosphatase PAP2 family protein n=1 Tax=Pyxidicoccus fallax TaxID=394095 RepID=A0A848M060_9BACT|nr:phosphatase PAP2 family protein [Pyxidicoccus fallax]NMO22774.1 phosphatase PAP2 family protein [Pyxidicoccus fallax]NPC84935.1 phosphatase PAP2 family protein [Pyxidicoccus fallax]
MLRPVRSSPHPVVIALLLALAPLSPAVAQDGSDEPRLHELRFDWARDGVITGTAGVLWISSEAFFKDDLAPAKCRWCDRAPDGTDTLNRLDRWGRGLAGETKESRDRANTWSNIMGFGVVPVGVLGLQYALGHGSGAPDKFFAQDATIIVQSAVLASLANQTVKFIVGRERPFVHQLPEDQKPLVEHASDNNLSFYSGHTNLAFAMVVSAGTVASLRGYKNQAWIWALGLPAAASVGLLRMGADKHYLTDVATGAVLGAAFGLAVPLLLHGRTDDAEATARRPGSPVRMAPMAGHQVIGLSGAF